MVKILFEVVLDIVKWVPVFLISTLQNKLIQSRSSHFTEQQQELATYEYLVPVHLLHAKIPHVYL